MTESQFKSLLDLFHSISTKNKSDLSLSNNTHAIGSLVTVDVTFTEVRAVFTKKLGKYFFTFTGKVRNEGFAFTTDKQDHIF